VKLSEIRKAFGLNGKGMPTGWVEAIHNYFSSPLSSYTLADLCTRYDVFIRSPVNQYGRPLPTTTITREPGDLQGFHREEGVR